MPSVHDNKTVTSAAWVQLVPAGNYRQIILSCDGGVILDFFPDGGLDNDNQGIPYEEGVYFLTNHVDPFALWPLGISAKAVGADVSVAIQAY